MRNSILDNEDLPISNGYLFTLFNWTVLLTSLFFFISANLFFNAIDTKAWKPIQISLLQQLGMDFSATQFLLLLLIFYINFGVIWSAFYLMMRKRFNR